MNPVGTIPYEGKASMLVRRPPAVVFEALVNPQITSRFWFTKGSGRLENGARVKWDWEMHGLSAQVRVLELEQDRRILIEWSAKDQAPSTVEWILNPADDGATYLTITQRGFKGNQDEIVKQAIDATGGFSFFLAGLKALLEHDINLNLTADHSPRR